jgi:hypothetical protein
MQSNESNPDIIVDFISGQSVPHVGPEINRQKVERYLVEEKGYLREEICVDAPIEVEIDGEVYRSTVDLVVQIEGRPLMAIKCAAGSLGSREREIVSAARLFSRSPLPLAIVSDGTDATILDTMTGKKKAVGMAAIPPRDQACKLAQAEPLPAIPSERLPGLKLVFRSYDSMNVNVRNRDG